METAISSDFFGVTNWLNDWFTYATDATQRIVLFTDIMRKRGNLYLEHAHAGQPPVLVFDFEMVLDGRYLEPPVNYAIVKIIDPDERAGDYKKNNSGKSDPELRPIVVIDPRAGHGPGIGGSKLDSQIGVALKAGHPVYFVTFYTDPEPGQTIADVQRAEVKFLEEVRRRHPHADLPAVIGNCQAGWATALIGADRPDVTGPMVFNGSPLSYWGGVEGANPMRYKGGLSGGVWVTSLWSDLGNGTFDGANLVYGFEELNPAHTMWTKQYHVYANVDTEEERYLNFEKWWGGFFKMNREEIHFIVDSLFVGNELEQGRLRLDEDTWVNLKDFKDPIVVFASQGDNITPPQQALNWIYKVYKTVDEIKRNGQVIVYIVHPRIGHLGIFVGSKIARKEHSSIIGTVDMIEYLAPGLYEMVITDGKTADQTTDRKVEFVPRQMEDILALDDGLEDECAFTAVAAISKFNDKVYLSFISPLVRSMMLDTTAEVIRQLHPLRSQRYVFADLNPTMWPVKYWADWIKKNRLPVKGENVFSDWEKKWSEAIAISLDYFRDSRDLYLESTFKLLYENPWMQTLFPEQERVTGTQPEEADGIEKQIRNELWQKTSEQGGVEAAVVRIILAVSAADAAIDPREYMAAHDAIVSCDRLGKLSRTRIKHLVKQQAAIIDHDKQGALKALPKLLTRKASRQKAFEIAYSVAQADLEIDRQEQEMLDQIKAILKL